MWERIEEVVGWKAALVTVGLVLVTMAFLPGVFRDPETGATVLTNPFRFVLVFGPGAIILLVASQLRRLGIDDDLHGRVVLRTGIGIVALLLVVGLIGGMNLFTEGAAGLSSLSAHLGASVGAVAGVAVGVNEARAVTQTRVAARRRAEATTAKAERKSLEFINNLLRHHVLNGLHVVRGNAEILVDEHEPACAQTILKRSDSMADLVQNVRTLVDADTTARSRDAVDVSSVVRDEVAILKDGHPEAVFDVEAPAECHVAADSLLPALFANLLRNAVEHNDAATPHVAVTVDGSDPGMERVEIRDNGPGIDSLPSAFDPGDSGEWGIGLHLVETLVDRYDGDLDVETGEQGTTFEVTLHASEP